MRVSMGIVKNSHGVYHERKKVPKALEEAVALVIDAKKPRVAWLKKTLGTKDLKTAKVRAVPVIMEFDRILAQAEALRLDRQSASGRKSANVSPQLRSLVPDQHTLG